MLAVLAASASVRTLTSARVHFSFPLGYCSASFSGISYVIWSSSAPTEAIERTVCGMGWMFHWTGRRQSRAAGGHCGAAARAFTPRGGGVCARKANRRYVPSRQRAPSPIRYQAPHQHVPDEAQGRTSRTRATVAEAPAPPRRASGASVLAACLRACRGSIPPALPVVVIGMIVGSGGRGGGTSQVSADARAVRGG